MKPDFNIEKWDEMVWTFQTSFYNKREVVSSKKQSGLWQKGRIKDNLPQIGRGIILEIRTKGFTPMSFMLSYRRSDETVDIKKEKDVYLNFE